MYLTTRSKKHRYFIQFSLVFRKYFFGLLANKDYSSSRYIQQATILFSANNVSFIRGVFATFQASMMELLFENR